MSKAIKRKTVVDELVEDLSRDIFRGAFEIGENLPPLRALSKRYGVTVPTTQRAIARIEEMGLLRVRHGSGMQVLNPETNATLSAFPYWLDALRDHPEAIRKVLGDFLELRRDLALSLLERVRSRIHDDAFAGVQAAVDNMEEVMNGDPELMDIVDADLAIAHAMLKLYPQTAYSTIFNVFDRVLHTLPEVAQALYTEPQTNVASWRILFELMDDEEDLRSRIEPLIRHVDSESLDHFERIIRAQI